MPVDLEKRRKYKREWMRRKYHENPEHYRRIWREYYRRNAERIKAKKRQKYWENPELSRQKLREYRKRNPLINKKVPKKYQNLPKEYVWKLLQEYAKTKKQLVVFAKEHGISYSGIIALFKTHFPSEYAEIAEKKIIKSNRYYKLGRDFEYKVRNYLLDLRYIVFRTARSLGPPDLIALHKEKKQLLFIECKRGGRIAKKEKEELIERAEAVKARPLLAYREGRGKVGFKDLRTGDVVNLESELYGIRVTKVL